MVGCPGVFSSSPRSTLLVDAVADSLVIRRLGSVGAVAHGFAGRLECDAGGGSSVWRLRLRAARPVRPNLLLRRLTTRRIQFFQIELCIADYLFFYFRS